MLKALKNLIPLDHKVALYVPSLLPDGTVIENRESYINRVRKLFSSLFGGCTSTKAVGSWVLETGKVQNEGIEVVFSYTTELTEESIESVIDLATALKHELKQEAISIEVDNKLYFI